MKRVNAPGKEENRNVVVTDNAADPAVSTPDVKRTKTRGVREAMEVMDVDGEEELAADAQRELRPELPLAGWEASELPVVMQWIDMDMYSGSPIEKHPVSGRVVPGIRKGESPVIRVFGVTREGHSVMAHVHGVSPYFYCEAPSEEFTAEDCGNFRKALDDAVRQSARSDSTIIVAVAPKQKQSIMGFQNGKTKKYLQVFLSLPNFVPKARGILQDSFKCPGFPSRSYLTYESNVPFVLRYMVDNNIVGGGWLEIPKGHYVVRDQSTTVSRCQVELDVVYDSIISHDHNIQEWAGLAPLRILSFDIECMGRRGAFPDPEQDPVIQIATYLKVQGEKEPRSKVVMVLGTCLPIVGARVEQFQREEDLLLSWAEFVRNTDPDIVTGYNIQNFDFPYLIDRAKKLKIGNTFAQLSKLKNKMSACKKKTFSSAAYGTRENQEIEIEGRVVMDMILYMYRNHKMSSYSLNAVSAEFLGMQKEDVHHSIISDLQKGTDEDRHRLAVYCLKDSFLPLQLMEKLLVLINYIEMARVTGVPIPFLFSRGQQIKVLSMLYRKGLEHDLIVPVYKHQGGPEDGEVGYEGATVIEPIKGFYDEPIATLDFASLYPSIMQAHNLCYTTLLAPGDEKELEVDKDYKVTPAGHAFVTNSKQKGVLPIILEELLAARTRAKKDMKEAKDPLVKAVMNGRQLALKVSANSVYGFTGATVGSLPCLPISASVTAYGREMINQTKDAVEEMYTIANGFQADAKVIYGDTDSVMVKFGVKDVGESMKLGLRAAKEVTEKLFVKPIALEFEKVYYPYLLMNKKRYAGMYWSKPEKPDKMDCKGIETVRRDNCGLVRTVIGTVLRKILIEHSVDSAVQYVKETIAALLQNKIDISLLIISKSLSAKAEDYGTKQAHAELADRMRQRDAGSAPVVGDRVPYVIIEKAKGTPAYLKSEDPIYVLEHNLPIDFQYYLKNQLSKPLLRIFGPIMSNPDSLLNGDHTRVIHKATPSSTSGIARYAVKKIQCLGCKTSISKGALCENCEKNRSSFYLDRLDEANELEERFSRLWTECQRCQNSLHMDVLCSNRDCNIFYMRKKVQHDLLKIHEKLDTFADL